MELDATKTKLIETAKRVIERMGFSGEVNLFQESAESRQPAVVSISSSDSGFLIGKSGNNLEALEHILRIIVNRVSDTPKVNFVLDVNDYRKIKTRQLTEKVREVADRVTLSSKAEALEPMSAYERRLVHMELAAYSNIATESIGEEPKRRVIIKPLLS